MVRSHGKINLHIDAGSGHGSSAEGSTGYIDLEAAGSGQWPASPFPPHSTGLLMIVPLLRILLCVSLYIRISRKPSIREASLQAVSDCGSGLSV